MVGGGDVWSPRDGLYSHPLVIKFLILLTPTHQLPTGGCPSGSCQIVPFSFLRAGLDAIMLHGLLLVVLAVLVIFVMKRFQEQLVTRIIFREVKALEQEENDGAADLGAAE